MHPTHALNARWGPLLTPGPQLLRTLLCHHNVEQIQSSLPLDAQELHHHLISEELQTREEIHIASEAAVRIVLVTRQHYTAEWLQAMQ